MEFFKKKDAVPSSTEPPAPTYAPPPRPAAAPPAPAPAAPAPEAVKPQAPTPAPAPAPAPAAAPQKRSTQTVLGSTLSIRGDITSDETITIEGAVDGSIETSRDVIVAPEGRVKASIRATTISISGRVKGNVVATNKVDLSPTGQLEGNIHAPKLSIAESALFKGSIDMSSPPERKAAEHSKESSKK